MEKLTPNPGGKLAIDEIVGREREIRQYWRALERQSLVLSAERRIGKTQLVSKMHGVPREGFVTIYQDLESVHSRMELVREVYRGAKEHMNAVDRVKTRLVTLWDTLAPKKMEKVELPEAKAQWKQLLRDAITDVLEALPPEERLLLIWDELPLMVHNIARQESPDAAIELLDLLRAMRAEQPRLRFIFTGSIGLHLVLRSLRISGNANEPTNDMHHETVPPMARDEALLLTQRLLLSLRFPPPNGAALAEVLLDGVEGFPYYLHHAVDRLHSLDHHPGVDDVQAAVNALVFSDHDPARLRYYHDRIRTYYSADEAPLARAILGSLARAPTSVPLDALCNLVRHKLPDATDGAVSDVCALLRQDHYLTLHPDEDDPTLGFRWTLVKRWWKATQR